MNIIKSKILVLSTFCALASAAQAMESETLLTLTNKTTITARVTLGAQGWDDYGRFRRSLDSYIIKPSQTFKFQVKDLPREFTYPNNRNASMASSYYGLVEFSGDELFDKKIDAHWDSKGPGSNISFVFNSETNKYEVEK